METPRMFWQFLQANWHTYELRISENEVEFRELIGKDNPPKTEKVGLEAFISGDLQAKVREIMGEDVAKEAIESANWMQNHKNKPAPKTGFFQRLGQFFSSSKSQH